MATSIVAAVYLVLLIGPHTITTVQSSGDYNELYVDGVSSYYKEDWITAAETLQKSLVDYNNVRKSRATCHTKCAGEPANIPTDYVQDERLYFFHVILQGSACRFQCKKSLIGDRSSADSVASRIEEAMTSGVTHSYIQHSFFKANETTKAAPYAATHLYLSPNCSTARANMEFYRGKKELSEDHFKPLETVSYRDLYTEGQTYYNNNDYERVVEKFEDSLKSFYDEIEKCRSECESCQQYTASNDFASAMWNTHLSYLKCKYSCPEKLGEFREETYDVNFLGSFFHYLTYGYYHLDKMSEAASALMSHLRIEPDSKVAIMNRGYLKQQPGVTIKDFVEREDAKALLDRMDEEKQVLLMMNELLKDDSDGDVKIVREEDKNDEALLQEDFEMFPIVVERQEESEEVKREEKEEVKREESEEKVVTEFTVVETPKDHGGVERVLIDDLLTQEQCQSLLDLTKSCKEGDGYERKSPHTIHEKFEGLTVIDAAKGAVRESINKELVQLYLNASEIVRRLLVHHFHLTKTLYFSFTHLVCRTANPSSSSDRRDHSHPVHADNCVQTEHHGECYKRSPAYTWRDYSAVLYLNDDFEGGDFFFAHSPSNTTPQHYVKPKCGRMVGFSAGKENMHGVTAITKGRRCAIALWLTLDPNYKETGFDEAQILLNGASI